MVLLCIFLANCDLENQDCFLNPDQMLVGYAYSPFGHPENFANTASFLEETQMMTNPSLMIAGPWRTSLQTSGQVPSSFIDFFNFSKSYCFRPVYATGFRTSTDLLLDHPNNTSNISWTNEFTKNAYKNMVLSFALQTQPPYFFVDSENDFYFKDNPNDFTQWVAFYEDLYDEIKNVSPQTKIGVSFQFEHISGKGILNGWNLAQWQAMQAYNPSKVDIWGFTVYPFFANVNVSQIQNNYLDELFAMANDKPVAIVETGWPAESYADFPTPWTSSEAQQDLYVDKLFELIEGKNVEILQWLYLYPLVDTCDGCDTWKTFGSISLKNQNGFERPAFAKWVSKNQ